MTPEEIQELRDWAARKMGWVPPEPIAPGTYTSIHENEDFGIGPVIGYRHEETQTFYTLKEFEKFEYWRTTDGKPAKAPWGGLISRGVYYKWQPDNPQTGLIWVLVEKFEEEGAEIIIRKTQTVVFYHGLWHQHGMEGRVLNTLIALHKAARATEES